MKKFLFLFLFLPSLSLASTVRINGNGTKTAVINNGGTNTVTFAPIAGGAVGCTNAWVNTVAVYGGIQVSTAVVITGVTAGNILIVDVNANSAAATTIKITDSASSTYTALTKVTNAAGPTTCQIFRATASASGSITVTLTMGSSVETNLHVTEYAGLTTPNPVDVQFSGTESGAGTTFNTGAFTTTQAHEIIHYFYGNESTTVTSLVITSSAGTVTKRKEIDFSASVSQSADSTVTAIQTSKTATATWVTSTTDGVLVGVTLKAACGT